LFCEKGKRNAHLINPEEKRETVTVLDSIGASQYHIPPTFIFKGKRLHTEYQGHIPSGTYVFTSDGVYINSEIFFFSFLNSSSRISVQVLIVLLYVK
jgi:hypothetical protein